MGRHNGGKWILPPLHGLEQFIYHWRHNSISLMSTTCKCYKIIYSLAGVTRECSTRIHINRPESGGRTAMVCAVDGRKIRKIE
jgi:hypothetical protein